MSESASPKKPTADVAVQNIARVYAEALGNAATKQGVLPALQEEYDAFIREVLGGDATIARFFTSGAVGRTQRRLVLDKVLAGRTSELFFNFLLVLNDHERLDILVPISQALHELSDARARRVRVQVRAAVPLLEDQQAQLHQLLRETFQLEPVLETQVDPELIGGLLIRVGDWQYDATLRHQLEVIRSEIIARSSHEIQSRRDRFSITE